MPAYNEEKTIDQIIELVLSQKPVSELIIVEDCSKDGTWAKLQPWNFHYLKTPVWLARESRFV